MEFLFELLKEIARAVVRELSAYVLRKQLQKRTAKNPLFAVGSSSVGLKKDNA
ncbi:hypothetical protein ACQVTZ_26790 [Bacillus cereus]|uniref:hypothetical protein n=1 Tax=Bacillus cereus TaxID=1396 RepID=UPI003D653383